MSVSTEPSADSHDSRKKSRNSTTLPGKPLSTTTPSSLLGPSGDLAPRKSKHRRKTEDSSALGDTGTDTTPTILPERAEEDTHKTRKKKKRSEELADGAGDALADGEEGRSRTWKNHSGGMINATPAPAAVVGEEAGKPAKDKKKTRVRFIESVEESSAPASDAALAAVKRKKKRAESGTKDITDDGDFVAPAEDAAHTAVTPLDGKRTKKKKAVVQAADVVFEEASAAIKISKKRKAISAPEDNPLAVDIPKSKKQKRKSHITEFPDPADDNSLSEQAGRALAYAFARFADPTHWKFHKARQNWLLRNIWSDTNIPSKHVPLVSRYLAGVQGGVRDNLIKLCQEALASPETPSNSPAQQSGTTDSAQEESTSTSSPTETNICKTARACVVLAALEQPVS